MIGKGYLNLNNLFEEICTEESPIRMGSNDKGCLKFVKSKSLADGMEIDVLLQGG